MACQPLRSDYVEARRALDAPRAQGGSHVPVAVGLAPWSTPSRPWVGDQLVSLHANGARAGRQSAEVSLAET